MRTRTRWREGGLATLLGLVAVLGLARSGGPVGKQGIPLPARLVATTSSSTVDQPLDDPGLTSFFHPSAEYTPGVAVTVGLQATQFALGRTVRIEDRFPTGWAITNISHSGTLASGKVMWEMPLSAGDSVTVTYTATAPAGTTGAQWFRASAVFESDTGSQPANADRPILRAGSACAIDCGATASTGTGSAPLIVQFNASASPYDCLGSVSYDWDFGDGTAHSTLKSPSHTYTAAGTYTWKMTASIEGLTCEKSGIVVVSVCTLSCVASVTPASGGTPLAVKFQASATTSNCSGGTSFDWDFGDGSPHSALQTASHTFSTAGTFTWKLTVTASGKTCTRTGKITVQQCSLTCTATASAMAGRPPLVVSFSSTASPGTCSGSVTIDWDFGDGTSHGSTASVSHTYSAEGVYPWKLTTTVGGVTCQKSGRVMVSSALPITSSWARTYLIADAAHTAGDLGTNWVSDLVLHNPGSVSATATLFYLEKDADNSSALGWTVAVPAGQSLKLPDVVEGTFARPSSSGAILVGASRELIITSRTFNDASSGTYGQYIEGYPSTRAITKSEPVRLLQLTRNADFRTNIGFASAIGSSLNVKLDLYRADGSLLGRRTQTLLPFGFTQLNDVLKSYGTNLDDAFAIVQSAQEGAAYFTYASVIDNRTGDPVQVVPVGRGLQSLAAPAEVAQGEMPAEVAPDDAAEVENGEHVAAISSVKLQAAGANNLGQLGFADKPRQRLVPAQIPGLQDVAQVSAGTSHTLVRKSDRSIWVFGGNSVAQLGDSTLTHHSSPLRLDVLSDVGFVDAGSDHSMAVRVVDGSVWEWGFGISSPQQVPGLNAVTQALGRNHRVVLRSNNTVWVWGNNSAGQLGIGNTTGQSAPVLVTGVGSVKQVAIGNWHTMALTLDGKVYVWGLNSSGQVGDGTTQNRSWPVPVAGLPTIVAIAAGGWSSYAVGSDGKLYAWGMNEDGELGDGTTTSRPRPVQVSGLAGVAEVAAGDMHALARKTDGSVLAWGYGEDGQIGDGGSVMRLTPTRAQGVVGATRISAGARNSFAIVAGGKVMAWGSDDYGQLGLGRTVYSATPVDVVGVGAVVGAAAGGGHSLAVRNDGVVLSWGLNNSGQLGYNTGNSVRDQPTAVPDLQDVVEVSAGYAFSLALTVSGEVWSWGDNSFGQLGAGSETYRVKPSKVPGLPRISSIAAGGFHALVVTPAGKVWAWGYNGSGEVGNGSTSVQPVPVELTGISGVVAVSAGAYHSLAVTSDHSLWVWGDNYYYQLGDGAHADRTRPYKLTSMTDVSGVAAGWLHSMAVKTDKSLWSWGTNRMGQLGLGTSLTAISTPTRVVGIGAVDAVAIGSEHSIALQGPAGISTWGRNWLGQLGDGTTTNRWVPNSLYYLNQVFAASGGFEHTLLLSGTAPCWLSCAATASATSGNVPLAVTFGSTAQVVGCNETATYEWDFGDRSSSSSAPNPSHTYVAEGVYTWKVTVRAGTATCSRSGEVAVAGGSCTAPVAPLLRGPTEASAGADYTMGWSSTSPDNNYELQEATTSSFGDAQTYPVAASSRSFLHSGGAAAMTFFYRVRAVDSCESRTLTSEWSAPGQVRVKAEVGQTLYVLAAAHSTGSENTNWHTDLELHNPTAGQASIRIELLKRDADNASPQSVTRLLAAGQSERFLDVVQGLFNFQGAGTLRIVPTVGRVMATSRTFNDQPSGTFGQFIPAAGTVEAVPFGQSARLSQIAQTASTSGGFRTNIGFVNATPRPLTLTVALYRADGSSLGSPSWQLKPYEFKQIDKIITRVTTADITDGYAVLSTPTVGGSFLAYASVIDNRSGDPVYVPARVVAQGTSGREELTLWLPGSVPLVLVRIPAGSFAMGSPSTDPSGEATEQPQHSVTLSKDLFVGKLEVTQGQWQAVMGSLPRQDCGAGESRPVCQVTWQAISGIGGFLDLLRSHLQSTGQLGAEGIRLLTEAEWEYAARAGTATRFSFGDALDCGTSCEACTSATGYIWWCGNNSPDGSKEAGLKRPNGFGLFDMQGNLWEWVSDWWGPYSETAQTDPKGPANGSARVFRGGRWSNVLRYCRVAKRQSATPTTAQAAVGFRLAGGA
ncbi:MAG TPA: PKD domain-containing protein [Thermoanaerobaculaceae bacterium]|nr:PKD domain-containing protein [Thermoanaerobaculaceae bacterium]